MSRVTAIISALAIRPLSACLRVANHTQITPLPTKPSDKNGRTEAGECWQFTDMQMSAYAAASTKYTKELADAKAEKHACVMMAAGRRRLQYQQSVSQCVKPPRLRRG